MLLLCSLTAIQPLAAMVFVFKKTFQIKQHSLKHILKLSSPCNIFQVDLSTFEASNSLSQYDKELKRLRQMSSARIIAREISAYQHVQTVRILAHRNGDGRTTEGVLMVGSTVRGVRCNLVWSPVFNRALVLQAQ